MSRQFLHSVDILLGASALVILYKLYTRLVKSVHLPYPPGPPGYPLIGHVKTPEEPGWSVYRDWSQQYGSDVIHLNLVGTHLIVLNSLQSCTDLLEKRSNIYSDRPTSGITMLSELCGLSWSFGLQCYGPEWRDGRKAFQTQFHAGVVQKYRPALSREIYRFLRRLCANPAEWAHLLNLMAGGLIMSIGYAIDVQEKNDPLLAAEEHAAECVKKTLVPGAYLVDILPFLKYMPEWLPGAGFQREAKAWRKSMLQVLHAPYDVVKERMARDPAATPDCVTKSLMEKMVDTAKDPAYMERVAKSAVGSMYLAGSDTTLSIIMSCILAMVLHPDVQRRAQESIDRVCQGRLPDYSDYDALPYVHAFVREGLRWNPVVALNLPHRCTTDDIYKEYLIPEGSIVVANIRAILHDPTVYPDPSIFNPERFLRRTLDDELELDPNVLDPAQAAFGFGRRICPGRLMAYQSIWLALANLLAAFRIECAKDESGEPIVPSGEYDWGFSNHPKPFKCAIRPRSKEHELLVVRAAKASEE
ncbi:uncharacterized protein PHACADRAFT_208499 [Phanerochaete carnosa HHB-10118-sp]|uniref:Cytochrome P450 n=1 Tax=Phanerochaete carnosa (strain HHB-10118-sp) TaxID=650164 RepID=K5WWW5_PHACS|nr:uncharacterized protein PHACADRAFT_208499 [Phanerochaete carnosa HHB-10118-sp]EKM54957.1 hypothetical protein PHACADRAFT_208499 [Phanerochaete carnosa HHB-10118-sp]